MVMRIVRYLALTALLVSTIALAHSDGIYNPTANNVGNFEGIDSNTASGAALPAPSFVSQIVLTNSGSTWTVATANIGNPSYITNRRVILMLGSQNSSGRTVTGVTINGVTATVHLDHSQASDNTWIASASAVVPSGTTNVTITVTMSSTLFTAARCSIYIVDDTTLISHTPVVSTPVDVVAGTSIAPSVSQTINGFVFGETVWPNSGSKSATISGYTVDFIDNAVTTAFIFESLIPSPATNTATATTTWTGSFDATSFLTAWR